MIVLVSLIVLLRGLLVSTIIRMVHPYITVHSVEWFLHLYLVIAHTCYCRQFDINLHIACEQCYINSNISTPLKTLCGDFDVCIGVGNNKYCGPHEEDFSCLACKTSCCDLE